MVVVIVVVVRGFCCTEPQKATSKLGLTALTLVLSRPYIIITSTYNSHVVPISNRPSNKAPIQISHKKYWPSLSTYSHSIYPLPLPLLLLNQSQLTIADF